MESVQVKLEWENSLRRVTVARNETLAKLKATIASLLGLPTGDCDVKYRDEENDLVTIGSDLELRELLEDHAAQQAKAGAGSAKILRLIVVAKAGGSASAPSQPQAAPAAPQQPPQQPQQPEKEKEKPDFPWSNLSRALSDPDVVQRLQHALQSPAITEAITRFARGYSETSGDVMMAGLMASQQVPALLNLLGELMEDLPVLKDLQQFILTWIANAPHHPHHQPHHPHHGGPHHHHGGQHHHGCPPRGPFPPPPFGGPFGFPFGGPRPPFGAPPQCQQQEAGVQKHFGVFCDGCGSDDALKRASIAAGHQTRRGFIRGQRFKSQTVNDFDLCESCKANTERFPEDIYGPFEVVAAPQGPWGCGRGGRGGGGGGGWWRGAPHQHPWRGGAPPSREQEQSDSKPKQEEEFDFIEAIRAAVQRGTEAFVEATNASRNEQGTAGGKDADEIAKAIAESLKEAETPSKKKEEEAPQQPQQPQQTTTTPSAPLDPFVKWNKQLSQLEALGFENLETYIEFLEQEKGDLDRVVARIVSRDL